MLGRDGERINVQEVKQNDRPKKILVMHLGKWATTQFSNGQILMGSSVLTLAGRSFGNALKLFH